jgi:RNA polymerase sigma-70 factor, ECF subfamily
MDGVQVDRVTVFVELITQHQRKLYGFIYSFVPNAADADDLLQETNLVLWKKHLEYQLGTNFMTWACRIALLNVQNFMRTKSRSRLYFNEKLLSLLSDSHIDRSEVHSINSMLLIECIGKLSSASQQLLKFRYDGNHNMQDVAKQLGRPVASIYNSLSQIRLKLWECIQYAFKEEGAQ